MKRNLNNEEKSVDYIKIRITKKAKADFMQRCKDNNHIAADILRAAIDNYMSITKNKGD